ncbi:MAG: hypothetical protein WEA04_03180 [Candidatus Andersenbacteria bacterium]
MQKFPPMLLLVVVVSIVAVTLALVSSGQLVIYPSLGDLSVRLPHWQADEPALQPATLPPAFDQQSAAAACSALCDESCQGFVSSADTIPCLQECTVWCRENY